MEERERYYKEEYINIKSLLNQNDMEILNRLKIKINKDVISEYEFDQIKAQLLLFKDTDKKTEKNTKFVKILDDKNVSISEYNRIMKKIAKIYNNEVFSKKLNNKKILIPFFNELDDVFFYRQDELERYSIREFKKEIDFYEHLKIQDDIIELLKNNKVNKEIIEQINKKFLKQATSFGNLIEFLELYFFKAGVSYISSLNNEIDAEVQNFKNL